MTSKKSLANPSKTKISKVTKSVFVCITCGLENEVINSEVPPTSCYNCEMPTFKQTAKMEVDTVVTVTQLPFIGSGN